MSFLDPKPLTAASALSGGLADIYAPSRTVDLLAEGAVANSTTDDWAKFVSARTKAGSEGIVRLPARKAGTKTVYKFSQTKPDLSGVYISADPGVEIWVNDENPATKNLKLLTDLTIKNIAQNVTRVHPANQHLGSAVALAVAASARDQPSVAVSEPFDVGWSAGEFTGTATFGASGTAPNIVIGSDTISWSAAFASNSQGVHRPARIGAMYTATIETTEDATAAGYCSIVIASNATAAIAIEWRFYVGTAVIERWENGVLAATLSAPTNNGEAYRLPLQKAGGRPAAAIVSVRIVDATHVEIYINDVLVEAYTINVIVAAVPVPASVYRVGFTASAAASAKASIRRPIRWDASAPAKHRSVRALMIGDSQFAAAWSPLALEHLLPISFAGLTGGGSIEVVNISVSGSSSADWVTGGDNDINLVDMTSYDYVIINIGVNDTQGIFGRGSYATRLTEITTAVQTDGAVPVYNMSAQWTDIDITGTGANTTSYEQWQAFRTVLQAHCVLNGLPIANSNEQIANGMLHMPDNIHPDAFGQALQAIAVAQAIARHGAGGDPRPIRVGATVWSNFPSGWFANSWGQGNGAAAQFRLQPNGDVEIRGCIGGGTPGTTAVNFPAHMRPTVRATVGGSSLASGTEIVSACRISTAGALAVLIGSTGATATTNFTSIDGRWSTV